MKSEQPELPANGDEPLEFKDAFFVCSTIGDLMSAVVTANGGDVQQFIARASHRLSKSVDCRMNEMTKGKAKKYLVGAMRWLLEELGDGEAVSPRGWFAPSAN